MTAGDVPDFSQKDTVSVAHNLGISLGNAGAWVSSADTATIAAAYRLAKVIDRICDTGEDLDKLAALIGRFEGLLKQLKLTPLSRDASNGTAEVDDGAKYAESYLRLVSAETGKPKTTRAKSGSTGRKSGK